MLFVKKEEVCSGIKEINHMIDFIIYDGRTACLGNEGKLVHNGALLVTRSEHFSSRRIDAETIVEDYINHLFGKDKGYCNVFGLGGKDGHFINYKIMTDNHGIKEVVYDVTVNIESDKVFMSLDSCMNVNDIDFNSEWYYLLSDGYFKEKERRTAKTLKRK